jgi:hypothetical protein
MRRNYSIWQGFGFLIAFNGAQRNLLGIAALADSISFFGNIPSPRPWIPTSTATFLSGLGVITGLGHPTFSSYSLDAFFGTHTNGAGLTYTWAKGNGW